MFLSFFQLLAANTQLESKRKTKKVIANLIEYAFALAGAGGGLAAVLPSSLGVDPSVGPAMEAAGIAAGRLFSNKKESEKKDAYSISPKADLDKELRKQERMLVVFIDDLDRLSSEEIRLVFRIVTLLLIFLRLFMCSRLIVVWYQER